MNLDIFSQQIVFMHRRLDALYQGVSASVKLQPELMSVAFKELGTASEELQVAVEELQQQNEELAAARVELETQRQRYQELFEFAPNGYLVTDANGTIQEANHTAADLLKVSPRFLIGKPLIVFIHEQERQSFISQLNKLQQAAEQVQEDLAVSLCPRKGEPFDAALTVATTLGTEGKVAGMRICVHPVRDSKLKQSLTSEAELDRDLSLDYPKHSYLKGEIIPLKSQIIWQVCKGIVKLTTMSESGEEVLVGLAGPSMVFGVDFTSLQTYQATALCNVQLLYFSLSDLAASPDLTQTVLPQIKQRLRQTESLLAISGYRRVKDRFCKLLQLLKQEIGQPVEQGTRLAVRFTHQELADACSTTRVTITRVLGKLQEEGKIIVDSKNHIIMK